jgi:hypothetical protein
LKFDSTVLIRRLPKFDPKAFSDHKQTRSEVAWISQNGKKTYIEDLVFVHLENIINKIERGEQFQDSEENKTNWMSMLKNEIKWREIYSDKKE